MVPEGVWPANRLVVRPWLSCYIVNRHRAGNDSMQHSLPTLSIRQPWADLILWGVKDVENQELAPERGAPGG